MLEKLRKMLSERKEEIVERMDAEFELKKEEAISKVEADFKELERTTKVVLPVNLLELLANGGVMFAREYHVHESKQYLGIKKNHHLSVNIKREDLHSATPVISDDIRLESGKKYRVVVLVEKVKEVEEVSE